MLHVLGILEKSETLPRLERIETCLIDSMSICMVMSETLPRLERIETFVHTGYANLENLVRNIASIRED